MARLSEVYTPHYPEPFPSAWRMFELGAHIYPDALAITACHQSREQYSNLLPGHCQSSPQDCLQWTYREVRHASLVIAKTMVGAGITRGSTIIAPLRNGIETHLIRVVSFILQLTLVVLDADLLERGRRDELAYYIQTTAPEVVVVADVSGADVVREAARVVNIIFNSYFLTQDSDGEECNSWARIDSKQFTSDCLEELAQQQQPELDRQGNRVGLILFTSGTSSGQPKGCPQTVKNIVAAAWNQCWIEDVGRTYALHSPHSRAIYAAFSSMAMAFGQHTVQTYDYFDPEKTYDAIGRHGIETILLVPAQVKTIAAQTQAHLDWTQLTCLRRVLLGGDIITTDLVHKAERLFPHARVTTVWGMSEGTGAIGLQGMDITPPLRTYKSILTLGKAGRWASVRIVDPDGNVLPRGSEGELVINGPGMIQRYIDGVQPELFYTDDRGSWVRTGDAAVMDEDEHIFIVGRYKDVIKQSGINISPGVLEAMLNKYDGMDAAVVGIPHPIRGEVPVAITSGVVRDSDKMNIKRLVVDSLGVDYALKEVYGISELGMADFPYSAQGKVQKFVLKDAILKLQREKMGS